MTATDPFNSSYVLTEALAKAIGLDSGVFLDGYCGFNGPAYGFDPAVDGTTCDSRFGLYEVIKHEIRELLGGAAGLSANWGGPSTLDLYTYSAPHVRNAVLAGPRYASFDGGITLSEMLFNNSAGGDFGDTSAPPGPLLAWTGGGNIAVPAPVSDLRSMTAGGWGLTPAGLAAAGLTS